MGRGGEWGRVVARVRRVEGAEEGGWILVQIVGPGGEPVPGELLVEHGDRSKTQIGDDFRCRAIVERSTVSQDGHVHALSREFGTA